jgi:hypothetical protein
MQSRHMQGCGEPHRRGEIAFAYVMDPLRGTVAVKRQRWYKALYRSSMSYVVGIVLSLGVGLLRDRWDLIAIERSIRLC